MADADIRDLRDRIDALLREVKAEGEAQLTAWQPRLADPAFEQSARNLATYLALRHRELRPLQRELMVLGLSSLGRIESRVVPTLEAVAASLHGLCGGRRIHRPDAATFFAGEAILAERSRALFGPSSEARPVALLVTCPSEAADSPEFMRSMAERGVEAIRINCAHDDADAWSRMIGHARAATGEGGKAMRIFMDLGGPKIRTATVRTPEGRDRIGRDETLAIVPVGGLDQPEVQGHEFAAECTLHEAIAGAGVDHHVFYDDGKLGGVVERKEPWGLLVRVTNCGPKGVKVQPEKGLNFPDSHLAIAALTDKDREDLAFVATHADGVGFSFVQSAADVAMLQDALAQQRADWREMSLMLKIETPLAVSNLPEIVVQAAGHQPTAIMIARGDLAVEIGFTRLAEMQEEILWIAEAAQVPVVWATQVLERLIKKGRPSRAEMTDAAMSARAECVMLNKGPFLSDAVQVMDTLLVRIGGHLHKKTPQLRALKSW